MPSVMGVKRAGVGVLAAIILLIVAIAVLGWLLP
jgi:hypothetical protein